MHLVNLVIFCGGKQPLMPQEDFCSSGGQFSGIYLLPGLMRSTLKLLHLILRFVFTIYFSVLISLCVQWGAISQIPLLTKLHLLTND